MEKRAQLSIFVIIGFVIMVTSLLLLYTPENQNPLQGLSGESAAFRGFVESCMSQVGERAIYDTSLQGGYYRPPELSAQYFYIDVPYYWRNGTNYMPAKDQLESELALYLFENLNTGCLDDFTSFKEIGYNVSGAALNTVNEVSAIIRNGDVLFSIRHPIGFTKEDTTLAISSFQAAVPIDLKKAYDITGLILQEQREYPHEIPLSFISLLAKEKNFTFGVMNYGDDEILYSMVFDIPFKEPLVYGFVSRYDWSELRHG